MAKKKATKSTAKPSLPINDKTELELGILEIVARYHAKIVPFHHPTVRRCAGLLGTPVTTTFRAVERLHESELIKNGPSPYAPLEITDLGMMVLDAYDRSPVSGTNLK